MHIRPFRNSDLPDLAQLWNQCGNRVRNSLVVTATAIEVVLLSRPFFNPDFLLIATEGSQIVGALHWLPAPDVSAANVQPEGVICSVLTRESPQAMQIANGLFAEVESRARLQGIRRLILGQASEHWTGYAGLGSYTLGGGIPETEVQLQQWARENGYSVERHLETYALRAAYFRPAMDRELIALRRSTAIQRRNDITDQPFRIACAISHLETHRFFAVERTGTILAEAEFMLGDPEMQVVNSGTALLHQWRGTAQNPTLAKTALRFLLTTAAAELIAARTTEIFASIDANDPHAKIELTSAGFTLDHRGFIFAKTL